MIGEPAKQFEAIVADLFRNEGFAVSTEVRLGSRIFDMILESQRGQKAFVEVKLYRTRKISDAALLQAILQVEFYRDSFPDFKAILVISSEIEKSLLDYYQEVYPNVMVYGYNLIAHLASNYPELRRQLDSLLREATPTNKVREDTFLTPPNMHIEPTVRQNRREYRPEIGRGEDLASQIFNLKAGKKNAKVFEILISEALRYIFDQDLVNWSEQHHTSDRLSYFDMVAKISSSHDFWRLVSDGFRSYYVVFEYKNCNEYIQQNQIYSTEKYLYTAAMRSTAIIVSPKGFSKNASIAASGALREAGKLIISLKVDQLMDMLIRRDKADDHNAILIDIVDQLLMSVGR